jgi:two-component system, OmpR family, KDP operon response regulator KdpE
MTRILIVDDEAQILKALSINLRARGFEVDLAIDGREALEHAASNHPDLVLLDLGLPKLDGLDVIGGLRGWTQVPIIVLSVRETEADKVAALDRGADDYLTKPFGMNELLARIRAVTRRHTPAAEQPQITTEHFTIDLTERRITARGDDLHLTPTEWAMLDVLARHPGRLVTQRHLLNQVRGPNFEDTTGYIRVHLAHLRQKLEPEPSRPRYFLTEPGIGYRFEP